MPTTLAAVDSPKNTAFPLPTAPPPAASRSWRERCSNCSGYERGLQRFFRLRGHENDGNANLALRRWNGREILIAGVGQVGEDDEELRLPLPALRDPPRQPHDVALLR